ncbi:MAG: T9SS type A sorting domain-containing protein [Candidatus Cloacimonetes bacterium]|nr:T9SS type A sorting domain-containing protein [Candidatus Cloacimonadota bacterium]
MKIKIYLLSVLLALFTLSVNAQIINLNPDPDGEPWIAGDLPEITPKIQARLDAIPEMALSSISSTLVLPEVVDNSQNIFMRPIFSQTGDCCGQASGVGYDFTYEINCVRNISSSILENQYPTHYTWNFLNNGNGSGSWYYEGWDIIMENGCPNDPTWGGMAGNSKRWMTGYENYYSGIYNKVDSYWFIHVGTPDGLETFKHWIYDHNNGSDKGGLGCFSIYMSGNIYDVLPPESAEAGKKIIADWNYSTGGYHAMTFVGYNNNIKYDINGDGLFTNDMDTNDDGIINMKDWEIGALKIANSWGLSYPGGQYSDGYVYFPYRLLAKAGAITSHKVHVLVAKAENNPALTLKVNIDYPCRDKLKVRVGYANNANQSDPITTQVYSSFNNQGGCWPMQGINNEPIETGFDFTYWYLNEDVGKIFFIVDENENGTPSDGTIGSFSIVDHRWGQEFELPCEETNVPIVNNDQTTLYVDYDLLVPGDNETIDQSTLLSSNMISRFAPTVTNNATLAVQNRVNIDMYNSTITIDEGSNFLIGSNVTINAKRGVSKIIINGNLQVGSNVTFTADEGSTIELYLNNQPVSISGCHFNNCNIISCVNPLTISQCSFSNSYLKQSISNLSVSGSSFSNSSVLVANPTMGPMQIDNSVSISDCDFTTAFDNANSIIEVYGYKNYEITNNTIDNLNNPDNTYHGISVHYSGSNEPGTIHEISNNEIMCTYGFCDNNLSGITIYSSIADINANYIHANLIGLQSLGNSEVAILGNENAVNENETQRIKNNLLYQIYASVNAFPIQVHWNAIYSSNNANCFVYHDVDMSTNPPDVDVSNNYWGPVFDANANLCPTSHYIYDPIWNLTKYQIASSNVQQLFETGIGQIADSNYYDAKSTFQQVVTSYPDEEQAYSSLKEIFYLEPLAGNNFEALKNWYLSEPAILNHEQLLKLSQNLANKCNEKLENYPDAIEWYENIIENPESLEDSIFAIIDLEHLYWQMGIDTTLRSATYVGRLGLFKPKSFKAFIDHKDELLTLLHGGQSNSSEDEEIEQFNHEITMNGELGQNFPNPFNGTTQISYHLMVESNVKLNIYNYNGQLIKSIEEGSKLKGTHVVLFDSNGLKSGIYFYSININGQTTDSKKMTILK